VNKEEKQGRRQENAEEYALSEQEEGKKDTLDHSIREANIPYAERPQYKGKLLLKLDLNKEAKKMTEPIWQGTEGLWHDVEALKFRPLTDLG
jgi:hypothetical protein